MLSDRSIPIIHRFSNFLNPTSKSKLDHSHILKSPIRYDMCQASGIGLGIFAALDKYAPDFVPGSAKSSVVCKCTNGDQIRNMMKQKRGGFSIFSLRVEEDLEAFPGTVSLTFCNLCRMKLSGKDIYMYKGEKAFCSEECRAVQISKDERKEECTSLGVYGFQVAGVNSCPASARDQMHLAGIFAI